MYQYAERPQCPDCGGSQYLFCDNRGNPHCVSKIKLNGWCSGFEVCFKKVNKSNENQFLN
jgi:hypothetical protein